MTQAKSPDETLPDVQAFNPLVALFQHASKQPDFVMMVQGDDAWTYERFVNQVQRLSRGFMAHGIKPGDRIVLQLGQCPAAAIGLYAGMLVGAIVVPVSTHYVPGEVERLMKRLKPAAYLCHGDLYGSLTGVGTSLVAADSRFVVDGIAADGDARSWLELLGHDYHYRDTRTVLPFNDIDAPAILAMTSGSTGEPKLVVHTQRTLASMMRLYVQREADKDKGVVLSPMPLFHMPGISSLMLCATSGKRLVLPVCRDFDPHAYLDAIERHRCTQLVASPYGISELIKSQVARPRSVESMTTWVVTGDFCRSELQEKFELVFGKTVRVLLGMTEAVGSFSPGRTSRSVRGPLGDFRLVDENGDEVAPGELGELIVRGDNLFRGYWHSPGVIDDVKCNGWYYTGDILRQDQHGDLWYVTRKKEIIVRDGENIAPVEIEQALLGHPAAADAAVIGMSDPALGERIVGFIKLAADAQHVTTKEILNSLALKLADYKIPEVLLILSEIPRTVFGKADRRALAAFAAKRIN